MPVLDWAVCRLSKSQDEMYKTFQLLNVDNVEIREDVVTYHDYSFIVIDGKVSMINNFTGDKTTAWPGMNSYLLKGLQSLSKEYREKRTSSYFNKIKKENVK